MLKYKRVLWIAFAILFVVVLFFIKNKPAFKNKENQVINQGEGLSYDTAILGDLVNRDTDGDGVLDWEESLWGTDPTKKETTPGIPDSTAISKLKTAQNSGTDGQANTGTDDAGNLTKTDQFSREFLATVTALNQNGAMDQATADKLSSSLADRIQNSAPRKVFLISNIKIAASDNVQSAKTYSDALNSILAGYTVNYTVLDVMQKLIVDGDTVDLGALTQLDPIIAQTNKIIDSMVKTSVPQSLALLHLDVINAVQRLVENVSDIKLFDTDSIVALSAISQYDQNTNSLASATQKLDDAINQKLNN